MRPVCTLLLILFVAALACFSCSGGGDDQGNVNEPDDDDDDDDSGPIGDDDLADDDLADDDIDPGTLTEIECGSVITKNVFLKKDLDCSTWPGDYVVQLGADDITFNCNQHRITAPPTRDIQLIQVNEKDDITIKNCVLTDGSIGVSAFNGNNVLIENNTIENAGMLGISVGYLDDWIIAGNVMTNETRPILSGIEIWANTNGEVYDNQISNFLLCGINLYGCSDSLVYGNVVHDNGDGCYGFFDDPPTGAKTHDVEIYDNEGYRCGQVGGNEVMDGSYNLYFHDNYWHDNFNVFSFYDGEGDTIHDNVIEANTFTNNTHGILTLNDVSGLEIIGNDFVNNDVPMRFDESENITIFENTFSYEDRGRAMDYVLNLVYVDGVMFNNNVIYDYDLFFMGGWATNVDLTENYWNGCPDLNAFSTGDVDVLDLINPINSLPCFYVDPPIDIVDGNGDGFDDEGCERPFDIECIDP